MKPVKPNPDMILAARKAARLTQAQAGAMVGVSQSAWNHYETGYRKMSSAAWELFEIKTGQSRR